VGQGAIRLDFHDFVKPSDTLSLTLDTGNLAIQKIDVKSYLDSQDDAITLNTSFAINGGVSCTANSVLNAPAKNIQVVIKTPTMKDNRGKPNTANSRRDVATPDVNHLVNPATSYASPCQ
jgi:hypothetical protein